MSDLSGDNGTNNDAPPPLNLVTPVREASEDAAPVSDSVDVVAERKYIPFAKISLEGVGFSNPRTKLDKVKLKEVADSIKNRLQAGKPGLKQPLVIWETVDEDGKPIFLLVGGSRRYSAIEILLENGDAGNLEDEIPYEPYVGDLKGAMMEALLDNMHREDLTSFEMANAVYDLSQLGYEQKEIAQRLSKSPAWVSLALSTISKAEPVLMKAWKSGQIPMDSVIDLAKLDPEEQEVALAEQLDEREDGSKSGARSARKATKKRTKKMDRATTKELTEVLVAGEGYSKNLEYNHGLMDALRFAAGLIDAGQFAKPWKDFQREKRLAAEAKAEEAAKPKRGPGRPRKDEADVVVKRGPGRPRKTSVDDDE